MTSLADETRWMDAVDQAALVARGEVTPLELLDAAIERIELSASRSVSGQIRLHEPVVSFI